MQVTQEQITDRMGRGMDLARENLAGVEARPDGTYAVPSSKGDKVYVVDLDEGSCTCPDHEYRGLACKHSTTARIYSELFPAPAPTREDPELTRLARNIEAARAAGDPDAEEAALQAKIAHLDATGCGQTQERIETFHAAIELYQERLRQDPKDPSDFEPEL